MLFTQDWLQRPIQGAVLDPSNSFARALGACFQFQSPGGAPRELLSGGVVTLGGTTSWGQAQWPQIGPCFQGDGSTGFGTIQLPRINSWAAFSVGILWSGTTSGGGSGRVLEKGANNEWAIIANNNNTGMALSIAGNNTIPTSATNPFDGKWHVIHATYNGPQTGNNAFLYIDGTLSGSGSLTASPGNINALNFMQYGGGGFHTASKFAGLWIWQNRALSAAEVAEHTRRPWQMFGRNELIWRGMPANGLFLPATLTLGAAGPFFQSGVNS